MRAPLLCLSALLPAVLACDAPPASEGEGEGEPAEGEGEGEPGEGEGEGEPGEGEGEGEPGEGEGEGEGEPGEGPLCIAGFCWELPLPAATTLQTVVVDGAQLVVGSDAGDVAILEGERVLAGSSPLTFINSLAGGGTGPVWAAGGGVWRVGSAATEPGVAGVFALHAFSDDDIWGVGASVYHYNGIAWLPEEFATTASMLDVHGTSGDDLWAVGLSQVRHRTEAGWQSVTVPSSSSLQAVWANAVDDVWVAGDNGTALHFDGAAWTVVATEAFVAISDLRGFAADDVWATSNVGVLHWDGATWSVAFRPGHALLALDGTANDLWAVGGNGYVAHFDGATWSRFATGGSDIDANIYDVSVASTGEAIALGRDFASNQIRLLSRGTDDRWTQSVVPDAANPFALLALDDGEGLLVGSGIWRGSGSTWTAESLPVTGQFRDACTNGDTTWAAGFVNGSPDDRLTLLRYTNAWREALSDTSVEAFTSTATLWCTGDADNDDVWAQVGTTHWHNTPTGIVRTDLAAFAQLTRAVAFAPDNAWGVVTTGDAFNGGALAFHYDGVEWHSVTLPGDDLPVDVTGTADDVWIQGKRSAWRVADGVIAEQEIVAVGGSLPNVLRAAALDDGSVMLVGEDESVWHITDGVAVQVVEGSFVPRVRDAVFTSATHGFGANDGLVELVDGSWTSVRGVSARVTDLWRTANDDIWAVGERSVLHFDGTSWTEAFVSDNPFERFADVWASGPDDVWVVSAEGTLLHSTAAGFAVVPGTVASRAQVFGSGPNDVWFVGRSGPFSDDDVIVEHKGAGSALVALSLPTTLVNVQRVGDVVMAADRRGGVWRRTATSGWQEVVAPQEPNVFNDAVLTALHFTSETDGYVVMEGRLGTFIGDGFLPGPDALFVGGIVGVDDDVYLLSAGGLLHRAP